MKRVKKIPLFLFLFGVCIYIIIRLNNFLRKKDVRYIYFVQRNNWIVCTLKNVQKEVGHGREKMGKNQKNSSVEKGD